MTDLRPEELLLTSEGFESTDRVNLEDLAATKAISKRLESLVDDPTYTRQFDTMATSQDTSRSDGLFYSSRSAIALAIALAICTLI